MGDDELVVSFEDGTWAALVAMPDLDGAHLEERSHFRPSTLRSGGVLPEEEYRAMMAQIRELDIKMKRAELRRLQEELGEEK